MKMSTEVLLQPPVGLVNEQLTLTEYKVESLVFYFRLPLQN